MQIKVTKNELNLIIAGLQAIEYYNNGNEVEKERQVLYSRLIDEYKEAENKSTILIDL